MKVVQRPELNVKATPCVECGALTRSHVLELPDYEEYEELIEDEMEEYQGSKKHEDEEENLIIRYQRLNDASCMCHKCWVPLREKATKRLEKSLPEWLDNTSNSLRRINAFMTKWNYYGFAHECPPETVKMIQDLRKAVKEATK